MMRSDLAIPSALTATRMFWTIVGQARFASAIALNREPVMVFESHRQIYVKFRVGTAGSDLDI